MLVAERVGCRLLELAVESGNDTLGPQIPAEENGDEIADRQVLLGPKLARVGIFDATVTEEERREPDRVDEQRTERVFASERSLIAGFGSRPGEHFSASVDDGPAFFLGTIEQHSRIAGISTILGAADHLDVGHIDEEECQARQECDGEAADRTVHVRASCEMRASRATSRKLATREDPP